MLTRASLFVSHLAGGGLHLPPPVRLPSVAIAMESLPTIEEPQPIEHPLPSSATGEEVAAQELLREPSPERPRLRVARERSRDTFSTPERSRLGRRKPSKPVRAFNCDLDAWLRFYPQAYNTLVEYTVEPDAVSTYGPSRTRGEWSFALK